MNRPASPIGWWALAIAALVLVAAVAAFLFTEIAPLPTPPSSVAKAPPAPGPEPAREPAGTNPPAPSALPVHAVPAPATASAPHSASSKALAAQPAATFLDTLLAGGDVVRFTLPGGETFGGRAERIERGEDGVSTLEGKLTGARPGTFSFERLVLPDGKVALRGLVMFESAGSLYRLESRDGRAVFLEQRVP